MPSNDSTATGHVEATLDTSTNTLTWTCVYSGLSAAPIGAHFHGPVSYIGATSEENAPIQVGTPGSLASPFSGKADHRRHSGPGPEDRPLVFQSSLDEVSRRRNSRTRRSEMSGSVRAALPRRQPPRAETLQAETRENKGEARCLATTRREAEASAVGAARSRRRRPGRRALRAGFRSRRGRAAQSLARPHRRRPVDQTGPFPAFDNFAWRAFVALAWPALTDTAHRGEPDRTKTLADPGPRVWETFKSRYEVFQRGPDGRALTPAKWASYDGVNPCGADADNRIKTLASFSPFADFNRRASRPADSSARWWRRTAPMCATRCGSTRLSSTRSSLTAGSSPTSRRRLQRRPISMSDRSRSKRPGAFSTKPIRPPSAAATTSSRARK